jgi:hypothetical protein
MKVVKPIDITDAVILSSTATETYAAYDAATTYALGDRVTSGNSIYECIQAPSTGQAPDSALYWMIVGPTNRWAMFDDEISTQTVQASPLTVVLKPGYVNSLAGFGFEGDTLDVTVRNGLAGPIVYSKSINLDGTLITNLYEYIYEPAVQRGEVVLTDLPTYQDAHITIGLSGIGSVKCGHLLTGTFYKLGDVQYGAGAGIIDYSRKDTSAAGVTSFVRRKYSNRASLRVELQNTLLNKAQRVLADLRATPCAWIGTDAPGYEPLTIFGFYRDFALEITYPTLSYYNLEIEGL